MFLAVAQSLNFAQAAVSLGLGQPTVSQHIRKFEQAVGRPLLVRDTRSVILTVDGEAMVVDAGAADPARFSASEPLCHFGSDGVPGGSVAAAY
ncbi:LysR family transcriptional regulator [Nocardia sp. NPDC059239]|uniref:helix-turn-helix domain-containing protein n=1 Tax=Nocardia sp. NPDC059239 TaxID=3346785 RepID=UPI0036987555